MSESRPGWLPAAHRKSPWHELHVVVTGLGVAGFAAADALQHLGARVTLLDDREPDPDDDRARLLQILGVHCFGDQAAEIVHIGQAIMAQPGDANNLRYFINTTFNYPTMAEAYRVAALNGYNRLF